MAGNSSKSPILKKLFGEYTKLENDKINKGESNDDHFDIYPPLGTEEAKDIQEAKGLPINTDITAPTGKTGVAYGLIQGRDGGTIGVISKIQAKSQSKFKYNIPKVVQSVLKMSEAWHP